MVYLTTFPFFVSVFSGYAKMIKLIKKEYTGNCYLLGSVLVQGHNYLKGQLCSCAKKATLPFRAPIAFILCPQLVVVVLRKLSQPCQLVAS